MKSIKGSKTEQNLMSAYAGECMARVKYGFYAGKARKDGYEQIGGIFDETGCNENEHAEIWFKYLHGQIGDTLNNLIDAASGENYEHTTMYPEFAKVAREEGFEDIATKFEMVAQIEQNHEDRYTLLASNISDGMVFEKAEITTWVCRNCGHIHIAKKAEKVCPVCSHPQSFFEVECTNF